MGPYRVRLLQFPVVLYNGRSFRLAVSAFDHAELMDRVLELYTEKQWQRVMSVEHAKEDHHGQVEIPE